MTETKVLYVIQHHDYSGAEILTLPIMQADPDPLLACPPDSRVEKWANDHGIPTVALPFRHLRHSGGLRETLASVGRGLANARELRALLRAHPERRVIHAAAIRPGMVAAVAKSGLGRRALWIVPDLAPPPPVAWATRLLALWGCDRALPLSHTIAASFTGRSSRIAARTEVVYPGIDPSRFDPSASTPGIPRAGLLGHISPTKRTDLAVDIAALVSAAEPSFELEILGHAQYRDEDRALERDLRSRVEADPALAAAVKFTGYQEHVPAALARQGLLLHCRPDEPFGMALIEAMAAGLPVVAPGAAGPGEIVVHGETGFLFRPGDAAEAAGYVLRLIREPELAAAMGAAGRRRVTTHFTVASQVEAVRGALEAL